MSSLAANSEVKAGDRLLAAATTNQNASLFSVPESSLWIFCQCFKIMINAIRQANT